MTGPASSSSPTPRALHTGWWLATVVVLLFMAGSLLDAPNLSYAGYAPTSGTVTRIQPDSPAERAGLEVGDTVTAIDGTDVTTPGTARRLHRPAVGETRVLTVERADTVHEIRLTYATIPPAFQGLLAAAFAIAAAFLACGLFVLHCSPGPASRAYAALGLVAGLLFVPPPYVSSFNVRQLIGVFPASLFPFLSALLLAVFLYHPPTRRVGDKSWMRLLIFGSATVLALMNGYAFLFAPALFGPIGTVTGLVALVQFLATLALAVQAYRKHDAYDRQRWGLGLMLTGLLIGIVPGILPALIPNLPGGNFTFVSLIVTPFAFAVALTRDARSAAGVSEAAWQAG